MFLSLHYCVLDIFATEKRVNHEGEYGLETPANFHFYGPGTAIKLAKNEVTNVKEKISETVKHCLSKINVLNGLFLDVSAIKRSVLRGNVIWDLKMMSTIEKCPLQTGFVMRV